MQAVLQFLGLKDGPLEQPGNNSLDGIGGAVHDQQYIHQVSDWFDKLTRVLTVRFEPRPGFVARGDSMKLTLLQNTTERLSKDLKRAARLHITAGQQAVDSGFSVCKPYVDLTQVVPLSHMFDAGEAGAFTSTKERRSRRTSCGAPITLVAMRCALACATWTLATRPGDCGSPMELELMCTASVMPIGRPWQEIVGGAQNVQGRWKVADGASMGEESDGERDEEGEMCGGEKSVQRAAGTQRAEGGRCWRRYARNERSWGQWSQCTYRRIEEGG